MIYRSSSRIGYFILTMLLAGICFQSFSQDFESSHLLIIVIDTQGSEIEDEPKVNVKMGIINNNNGINRISDPFNEY